jgi:hypothetical protein
MSFGLGAVIVGVTTARKDSSSGDAGGWLPPPRER